MCNNFNHIRSFSIYLLFAFIIFGFAKFISAQDADKSSIINQQVWVDFYPHYYVNKKLEYYGDTGYRTIVSEKIWSRLYARPSFKYHFSGNFIQV